MMSQKQEEEIYKAQMMIAKKFPKQIVNKKIRFFYKIENKWAEADTLKYMDRTDQFKLLIGPPVNGEKRIDLKNTFFEIIGESSVRWKRKTPEASSRSRSRRTPRNSNEEENKGESSDDDDDSQDENGEDQQMMIIG